MFVVYDSMLRQQQYDSEDSGRQALLDLECA